MELSQLKTPLRLCRRKRMEIGIDSFAAVLPDPMTD
jgi:hypothetical protein